MIKKLKFAAVIMLLLLPAMLLADEEIELNKGEKRIIIKKSGDLSKLDELKVLNLSGNIGNEAPDAPFVGIYPADLDFPKAQALNYPHNYGVLITGIVPNSPAYNYRLAEDDIIMEINGKQTKNLKEFDKLKSTYRAGDAVKLTVFRGGEVISLDFVFGSRTTKEPLKPGEIPVIKKSKLVGYGGGTWIPMWYAVDMADVNELVQAIGFSALPEDGVLTQGFGGKITVGKGWFVGGQFQFYGDSKKINVASNYVNNMDYNMFIGGATLDKRIPITRGLITSLGVMIGGAEHSVDLVHSNGDYNWPSTATATTTDIMNSNTSVNISKGYVLVQPRAEVMVRLLSWLGLRAEGGYIYGYGPTKGWKANHTETETYELKGSPDTKFQGYTVTVGPWFGF